MQNEVKKITRLVDEVTSLLMRSGSNDINVRIKRDSELSTITIIDYNSDIQMMKFHLLMMF